MQTDERQKISVIIFLFDKILAEVSIKMFLTYEKAVTLHGPMNTALIS